MFAFRFPRRSKATLPNRNVVGIAPARLAFQQLEDRLVPIIPADPLFTQGLIQPNVPSSKVIEDVGNNTPLTEVVTADFNGDGQADFAGAAPGANRVISYVSRTGSPGQFSVFTFSLGFAADGKAFVFGSPPAIATGDLNGDNRDELVVGNSSNGAISVLEFGGAGFSNIATLGVDRADDGAINANIRGITIGDYTNDAKRDMMVFLGNTPDNKLTEASLLINSGNGIAYTEQRNPGKFGALRTATSRPSSPDLNADGKTDVLFINPNTKSVRGFFGTGTGSFQGVGLSFGVDSPTSYNIGDFDGNGKLDVVVGSRSTSFDTTGTAKVFLQDSNGGFSQTFFLPAFTGDVSGIGVADFDGDGKDDIALALLATFSSPAEVRVFMGSATAATNNMAPAAGSPYGVNTIPGVMGDIVAIDLDDNGNPDLLTGIGLSNNQTFTPFYNKSGVGGEIILTLDTGDATAKIPRPEDFVAEFKLPITYTVEVCPPPQGGIIPTGKIEFYEVTTSSSSKQTITLLNSVDLAPGSDAFGNTVALASFTTNAFPIGVHKVFARYLGDSNYQPVVSANSNVTITKVETQTNVIVDVPNPVFKQVVNISTAVSPVDNRVTLSPGGLVLLFDNGAQIGQGTLDANGIAKIAVPSTTIPDFALGNHALVASYLGSDTFLASFSNGTNVDVRRADSAVSISIDKSKAIFGDTVKLSVPVSIQAPGQGTADGLVRFYKGASEVGTSTIANGTAFLTVPQLPVGVHTFTAEYLGNDSVAPSQKSASVGVTISPTTSQASLAATPTANRLGQTVTLKASVFDRDSRPVEVGTVTFTQTNTDGTTAKLATVNVANGTATTDVNGLGLGSANFQATFSGTQSITPATTNVVTVTTDLALTFPATFTNSGTAATVGKDVTFSVRLDPPTTIAGPVTGTVTFRDNGTPFAVVPLQNSTASATARLPLGLRNITADYSGDSTFAPSSPTLQFTVFRPSEPVTAGAGVGGSDIVRQFNPDGTVRKDPLFAFGPDYFSGARVTTGDFNGDGVPDRLIGTGPGTQARIRILDGVNDAPLFENFPFENFQGGVFVSAGDVNGDLRPDFVVTPDQGGGPRVTVFDGTTFKVVANYFGIEDTKFRGGARAAIGDVNNDGNGDVIVAAGFGGGPRVAVFNGRSIRAGTAPIKLFNDFFAFEQSLRNGAYIAAGDVDGDGFADLTFGAGPGGGPRVIVVSGKDLLSSGGALLTLRANFFAGDERNRQGVPVAMRFLDDDTRPDILTGSGPGSSRVTTFLAKNLTPSGSPPIFQSFDAFEDATGGVFVG